MRIFTIVNVTFSFWTQGTLLSQDQARDSDLLPILVKLDCKVCHVLQSFVGEIHFHIDVPLAMSKCSGNLQAFSLYCRQPDLKHSTKPNGIRQDLSQCYLFLNKDKISLP